ncbi:MAG: 30S ribosomal protein S6 [Clostridia bacterium]|nr:30S ribosomal protein S6 [Clostridia bacterium]MBQ3077100.1 30S ribosomal protein S6 [Clostridia bacterium]
MANNKYETILIVNPNLGEEGVAAVVEKFRALIAANGTIEKEEDWGKRTLAYEIDDCREGCYTLIHFEAPADFPAELERVYNITEGVLRSIVVARNEKE